jgi:hypothetical protein
LPIAPLRKSYWVTVVVIDTASAKDSSGLLGDLQLFEIWLGGLDSNQDNQIQNLMYCRLYDLPAGEDKKSAEIAGDSESLTSGYLYFIHEM